eukprot:TRINITY_DN956_c0_g1_i1.p1 TRINITY_DN956_c0_g1~~TRINITY_DN956_c0_g1_i1.p1  ORF type:complete len:139 (-),score=35.24 TRINITY_DN956_c0_g1_i1:315-731(-)
MIRRPPRSTLSSSSAASDVYKRQVVSTQSTGGFHFSAMSGHTIVLRQNTNKKSRTYEDYGSEREALDAICKGFEAELKRLNPQVRQLQYDISDLFRYIDGLGDLACMTLSVKTGTYAPHDKEWIKDRIMRQMTKQAGY